MGNYTTNLSLYNTDMNTDGNDTFDFQRDLNDNNDKIDSAIGKLSTLTTTDKSSLVNAIIEIVTNLGGKTSKSLDDLNAVGQAVLDKKVEVEALLQQNGYAKFSWKENNQISNIIVNFGKILNDNSGSRTVNFPLSFTNSVTVTTGFSNINRSNYAYLEVREINLSNFKIDINCNSGSEGLYSSYIAIGY